MSYIINYPKYKHLLVLNLSGLCLEVRDGTSDQFLLTLNVSCTSLKHWKNSGPIWEVVVLKWIIFPLGFIGNWKATGWCSCHRCSDCSSGGTRGISFLYVLLKIFMSLCSLFLNAIKVLSYLTISYMTMFPNCTNKVMKKPVILLGYFPWELLWIT